MSRLDLWLDYETAKLLREWQEQTGQKPAEAVRLALEHARRSGIETASLAAPGTWATLTELERQAIEAAICGRQQELAVGRTPQAVSATVQRANRKLLGLTELEREALELDSGELTLETSRVAHRFEFETVARALDSAVDKLSRAPLLGVQDERLQTAERLDEWRPVAEAQGHRTVGRWAALALRQWLRAELAS